MDNRIKQALRALPENKKIEYAIDLVICGLVEKGIEDSKKIELFLKSEIGTKEVKDYIDLFNE